MFVLFLVDIIFLEIIFLINLKFLFRYYSIYCQVLPCKLTYTFSHYLQIFLSQLTRSNVYYGVVMIEII